MLIQLKFIKIVIVILPGTQQQSSSSSSFWFGFIFAWIFWGHQLPGLASLSTVWHSFYFLREGWTEKQLWGEQTDTDVFYFIFHNADLV